MTELELLERAERGEELSKPDKLRLLWYLETGTQMTRAEMARVLRCSERHVYRLLIRMREELANEARREALLGRLTATYEGVKSGLLREIRALPEGQRWKVWKELWRMEAEYVSLAGGLALEDRVKQLEELIARVGLNGNSNAQPTP